MVKSVATVCAEIYEEVKKLRDAVRGNPLLLRVSPDVARALEGHEAEVLRGLKAIVENEVTVQPDPLLHQEQCDVVPR